MTEVAENVLKADQVDTKLLKAGDYISETQYYKVIRNMGNVSDVVNERGETMSISNKIFQEGAWTANQLLETKEISRTELAEILENAGDTIFTVNFNKQIKESDIVEAFTNENLVGKDEKELKKFAKSLLKGSERTMIAHLIRVDPKMGRTSVIDLETPVSVPNRIRQIDHRTLNWIIIKNVKYVNRNKYSR